ncbi:hypothetical protein ACJZ2D_005103 [Fusarium nematophilum]
MALKLYGHPQSICTLRVRTILEEKELEYERILSKNKYLAGNEITLGDLFHLPYGVTVEQLRFGELVAKCPAVENWWNELKEGKGWKRVNASE